MFFRMRKLLQYNNNYLTNKKSAQMHKNKIMGSLGLELIGNHHKKVRQELLRAYKMAIIKQKEGH